MENTWQTWMILGFVVGIIVAALTTTWTSFLVCVAVWGGIAFFASMIWDLINDRRRNP
jgi:multisubunit Na+/H+ antiporter MnhE subunit